MIENYQFFGGLLGLITLIVFFIIPYRLRILWLELVKGNKINDEFKRIYLNAETIKGINAGYLNSRECVNCNNIHSPDILFEKWKCPNCELNIGQGNIIIKYKKHGNVVSISKTVYDQTIHKLREHEILKEY